MNILLFSWRGLGHPYAGGAEYSTLQHAKGWIQAGHQVTLFTSSFKGAKSEEEIDGIRIIRKGGQTFSVHIWAMLWYLFGNHQRFDIVIDEIHGIPFFTPLFVRVPKLAFIHEVAKEVWGLNSWPFPFNLIPAVVGTLMEPLIFKSFYKKIMFMTVSESTKSDLINWDIPKKNISIIYNGFDNPNPTKKQKESKKTIIYLGTLSKDKGIEDALLAFSLIYRVSKDTQFWVVGKGESYYLEYLKRKVKLLGIEKVTKFFGFVSEIEKYNLLSKAYILINPSIREGWGFVVIEAASVGIPTVGYNVPGLRDSVVNQKTGLLCNPNPKSLADKVEYLLGNNQFYDFLSRNCLNWSKKFSWKTSVQASNSLIKKIINTV